MLHFRDGLLLMATLSSILTGIIWPAYGAPFQPYPIYCMMALLFFSFLPIRLGNHLQFSKKFRALPRLLCLHQTDFAAFTGIRFFPVHVSKICGRSAAFERNFIRRVISFFRRSRARPTFLSSSQWLLSARFWFRSHFPPWPIFSSANTWRSLFSPCRRLLGLVIFCPLILAEILKRFAPDFTAKLSKGQYSVSLVAFVIANLGIFSRYASFLREQPSTVLISLCVSVILAAAYFVAGMLFSMGRPLPDHFSSIIAFGFINNVLVLVLSSEFFSPLEATVAAMYTIPFFGLIVPLRLYHNWARKQGAP